MTTITRLFLAPYLKMQHHLHACDILALKSMIASLENYKRLTQINLNDLPSRKLGHNAFLVKSSSLGWQDDR